jgi:hypothetical protein
MRYEHAAIVTCPGLRVFPDSKVRLIQGAVDQGRTAAARPGHGSLFKGDAVPSDCNMLAWDDRYGWVQDETARECKHAWAPKYVRVNYAHAFVAVCAAHDLGANKVRTADRQRYPFTDSDMDAAHTLKQVCSVLLQALNDVGTGGT